MQEKNQFPSVKRYLEIKKNSYFLFPIFRRLVLTSRKEANAYLEEENPFTDEIERMIFKTTLMMPNDLSLIKNPSLLIDHQKQLSINSRMDLDLVRFKLMELKHYNFKSLIEGEFISLEEASQDYPPEYYNIETINYENLRDKMEKMKASLPSIAVDRKTASVEIKTDLLDYVFSDKKDARILQSKKTSDNNQRKR